MSRSPILNALARHRKSLFGRGFYGDLDGGNIRTAMYLEVIMKTCLYFIRSFYHLEQHNITQKDIEGNKKVSLLFLKAYFFVMYFLRLSDNINIFFLIPTKNYILLNFACNGAFTLVTLDIHLGRIIESEKC